VAIRAEVGRAADALRLGIYAIAANFRAPMALPTRLAWAASELERLSSEAYRLADEAVDDPDSYEQLDPCREPIPGFPPKE